MAKGISIIIETFNFEGDIADIESLKATVRGLLSQKSPVPFEVLVVVEKKNSTLREELKGEKGFRLVLNDRYGYVAMKNDGLKAAKYDLVGFVDADVLTSPNWIAEAVKSLQKEEVVTGRTYYQTDLALAKAASLMLFGFAQVRTPRYTDLIIGNNLAVRRSLLAKIPLVETPARGGLRRFSHKVTASGLRIRLNPKMVARHKYTGDTLWFKMFTDSLDYVRTIQQAPHLPTVPFPQFWPLSVPLIALKNFLKDVKNLVLNGSALGISPLSWPFYVLLFAVVRVIFFFGLIVAVLNPGYTEKKYGVY